VNAPFQPAHSPFGGSVAERIIRCPRSVTLVERVPTHLRKTSVYADRGSACHLAVTRLLDGESFADVIGTTFNGYVLNSDDVELSVRPVFTYLDALLDTPGAEYYVEYRVTFPGITGAFGTVDLIVRIGDTVYVIDYKFGSGVRVLALYPRRRGGHSQPATHVLRSGRAAFASEIFRRRRDHRPYNPAAAIDRTGCGAGIDRRSNPR
jgi:hypothetical protein